MSSDFSKILAIDECFVACGENVLDIRREVKASCPAQPACPILVAGWSWLRASWHDRQIARVEGSQP